MKRWVRSSLWFALAMLSALPLHAAPLSTQFSFSVIGQRPVDDATLTAAIRQANASESAFVVVNGIRPPQEACSDAVFLRRKKLLAESEKPIFVSLAGWDWAECRNDKGESLAQERLGFLRGLLFEGVQSPHASKLSTVQLSSTAKFRNHAENLRWEMNGVLFATVNMPSNNNHFLAAAGRNNEFEDRLTANRYWLQRLFVHAKNRKMKGIVLFADGNPMVLPARSRRSDRRDGFVEMRKQLGSLVAKYPGKVLLVHGHPSSGNVTWRDNLGMVGVGRFSFEISVRPGATVGFFVRRTGTTKR